MFQDREDSPWPACPQALLGLAGRPLPSCIPGSPCPFLWHLPQTGTALQQVGGSAAGLCQRTLSKTPNTGHVSLTGHVSRWEWSGSVHVSGLGAQLVQSCPTCMCS